MVACLWEYMGCFVHVAIYWLFVGCCMHVSICFDCCIVREQRWNAPPTPDEKIEQLFQKVEDVATMVSGLGAMLQQQQPQQQLQWQHHGGSQLPPSLELLQLLQQQQSRGALPPSLDFWQQQQQQPWQQQQQRWQQQQEQHWQQQQQWQQLQQHQQPWCGGAAPLFIGAGVAPTPGIGAASGAASSSQGAPDATARGGGVLPSTWVPQHHQVAGLQQQHHVGGCSLIPGGFSSNATREGAAPSSLGALTATTQGGAVSSVVGAIATRGGEALPVLEFQQQDQAVAAAAARLPPPLPPPPLPGPQQPLWRRLFQQPAQATCGQYLERPSPQLPHQQPRVSTATRRARSTLEASNALVGVAHQPPRAAVPSKSRVPLPWCTSMHTVSAVVTEYEGPVHPGSTRLPLKLLEAEGPAWRQGWSQQWGERMTIIKAVQATGAALNIQVAAAALIYDSVQNQFELSLYKLQRFIKDQGVAHSPEYQAFILDPLSVSKQKLVREEQVGKRVRRQSLSSVAAALPVPPHMAQQQQQLAVAAARCVPAAQPVVAAATLSGQATPLQQQVCPCAWLCA